MSTEILAVVLDSLTEQEMRLMLSFFAGLDPEGFAAALELAEVRPA